MVARHQRNGGFTLLDLLIVLMILGIVGLTLVPQFQTMISESRLDEATREVVAGLQYAGNLAIRYQRPFGVKADTTGNWFKVFDGRYESDSDPHHDAVPPVDAEGVVLDPLDKKWYVKDLDEISSYKGVKITSVPPGAIIRFYPDGHSSSSAGTYVLTLSENQKTITVNRNTGRISVQ